MVGPFCVAAILLAASSDHTCRQTGRKNRLTKSGKSALIEARSGSRSWAQPQAKPENMRTIGARGRRTYRRVAQCKHGFAMRSASMFRRPPAKRLGSIAPDHRMPRSDPDHIVGSAQPARIGAISGTAFERCGTPTAQVGGWGSRLMRLPSMELRIRQALSQRLACAVFKGTPLPAWPGSVVSRNKRFAAGGVPMVHGSSVPWMC